MRQKAIVRLLKSTTKVLSRRRVYTFADALGGLILRKKTDRLTADVRDIFPDRPDEWVRDVVRRQRQHRAWVAVDKYMVTQMSSEEVLAMHAAEDIEAMRRLADDVLAEGKGGIIYTMHYGRPMFSPFVFTQLGYPYVGLFAGTSNTGLIKGQTDTASERGAELFEAGDLTSGVQLMRALKDNKLLFVFIDGKVAARPAMVDFFGRKVPFSVGFAQLAIRSGAGLACGVTRTADDPLKMRVRHQRVHPPTGNATPEELGRALVAPLEAMIEEDVGQWYGVNRLFRQARRIARGVED
jgi:lauroyl/myristoyl acyltransferase